MHGALKTSRQKWLGELRTLTNRFRGSHKVLPILSCCCGKHVVLGAEENIPVPKRTLSTSVSCFPEKTPRGFPGFPWVAACDAEGGMGLLYLMCWERRRFGTCRDGDSNLTVAKACENEHRGEWSALLI